jgi:hypothetical protein
MTSAPLLQVLWRGFDPEWDVWLDICSDLLCQAADLIACVVQARADALIQTKHEPCKSLAPDQ